MRLISVYPFYLRLPHILPPSRSTNVHCRHHSSSAATASYRETMASPPPTAGDVDDDDADCEADALCVSEDLVQPRARKAAGMTELDLDGLLAAPLRLHEDLAHGCGGQLWPAGLVLVKYVLRLRRRQQAGEPVGPGPELGDDSSMCVRQPSSSGPSGVWPD